MKTLVVEVPDDVYEQAEQCARARGTSLSHEAVEFLKRFSAETSEPTLANARARMQELFRTVSGFREARKIPREVLYERGSVR